MSEIKAWRVIVKGFTSISIIGASTRGKAKAVSYRQLQDVYSYDEIPFTDIRAYRFPEYDGYSPTDGVSLGWYDQLFSHGLGDHENWETDWPSYGGSR